MSARKDTSLGGEQNHFPPTRWSVIVQAKDPRAPAYREAVDHLCRQYWKPVYAYVRAWRSAGNEEAKDLTQEFFLEILEGDLLSRFSPDCGSFRNYLRGALRHFLQDYYKRTSALKRGGGRRILSLNVEEMESFTPPTDCKPEEVFDREWARSLLDLAIEGLRKELSDSGKQTYFLAFERYELGESPKESTTYARLAQEFDVKETEISTYLAYCRRRLRSLLVDRIRDYVSTEGDAASELNRILQLLAPPTR